LNGQFTATQASVAVEIDPSEDSFILLLLYLTIEKLLNTIFEFEQIVAGMCVCYEISFFRIKRVLRE